mmetsp:Transcript_9426/g.19704  ORF Transcript_9426/g.19704 Transcript_9426/m.19704 type:complete len:255 (+) Transcript_9426:549-1313(+)
MQCSGGAAVWEGGAHDPQWCHPGVAAFQGQLRTLGAPLQEQPRGAGLHRCGRGGWCHGGLQCAHWGSPLRYRRGRLAHEPAHHGACLCLCRSDNNGYPCDDGRLGLWVGSPGHQRAARVRPIPRRSALPCLGARSLWCNGRLWRFVRRILRLAEREAYALAISTYWPYRSHAVHGSSHFDCVFRHIRFPSAHNRSGWQWSNGHLLTHTAALLGQAGLSCQTPSPQRGSLPSGPPLFLWGHPFLQDLSSLWPWRA